MMNRRETNNTEFHKDILEEIHSTYRKKNADYGDSFNKSLEKYGLISASIRMNDKFERFDSLIVNEQRVADENIDDTLLDLANYAIMTAMWIRQRRDNESDGGWIPPAYKGDVYLFDTEGYADLEEKNSIRTDWEKAMENFGNFMDELGDLNRKCEKN